jgi:hypothetical protein
MTVPVLAFLSSLNQQYQSKDGGKTAQLSVVAGQMAPQVQGFQSMSAMNMNMEAGGVVMKTVNISGKRCMVNLDHFCPPMSIFIPSGSPDAFIVPKAFGRADTQVL